MQDFEQSLLAKGKSSKNVNRVIVEVKRYIQWRESQNIPEHNESYNDMMNYVQYLYGKNVSKQTVRCYLNSLKHYFNYQIEEGIREDNPVINIKIKGVKRRKIYDTLSTEELESLYKNYNPKGPAGKRNKLILSLIIYQGLKTEDMARLETTHINLREGKIFVPGGRRINNRELKLEAHQVIDFMEYINETRKLILAFTEKESRQLFISVGSSDSISNIMYKMMKEIKAQNPKVTDQKQIRASVIINWLDDNNLRKTQEMAGHRYVSSTEKYQSQKVDDLQAEVNKYHPIN